MSAVTPQMALLDDLASSAEALQVARVLQALERQTRPWLADLPGGERGSAARRVRQETCTMSTAGLRCSVVSALELLGTRSGIDPKAYEASWRRYGKLLSLRAVEDEWISRVRARRARLGRRGDRELRRALDVDIAARKQQHSHLIGQARQAERLVELHEQRRRAWADRHVDHLHAVARGYWHARELRIRERRALDAVAANPPGHLLSELGRPPGDPVVRQLWQQGALAILRYRKDHGIQDPDRALGRPGAGGPERLRRSEVEVLADQTRRLIDNLQRARSVRAGRFLGPDLHPGC